MQGREIQLKISHWEKIIIFVVFFMSAHMRGDRFKLLLGKILFISISFERDEFNESFWFC